MIDRLDCSGAGFVGRHYLTLADNHEDFNNIGFFQVSYSEHMRPLLRSKDEQIDGVTMSEHLKIFADSQTNDSPYGIHDFGSMVEERNQQSKRLYNILDSISNPTWKRESDIRKIRRGWNEFLVTNIEQADSVKPLVEKLDGMFDELDSNEQVAWANGFSITMREYVDWANQKDKELLEIEKKYGSATLRLPGITENIGDYISPRDSWSSLI